MRSSCLKDLGKQWGGEQDLYDLNTVFDNVKKILCSTQLCGKCIL